MGHSRQPKPYHNYFVYCKCIKKILNIKTVRVKKRLKNTCLPEGIKTFYPIYL